MNERNADSLFTTPLQRGLEAPLYAQIQRDIELGIATRRFKPGDLVPGEIELANRFGVSRVTVRQALAELVAEGLLYRIQGKGTFVAAPMIQRAESNVTSFFYEMVETGRKPTAQAWSEVAKPDPETARLMQLGPGEKVIVTRRLRFVDGEPLAYQINITRRSICPGFEKEDLSTQSFQYVLQIKYGVQMAEVEERLSARMPDEELAQRLQIPRTVPVLLDARLMRGAGGKYIVRSQAYFRGDRYTYKLARRLAPSGE